jgi:hypothetical protein
MDKHDGKPAVDEHIHNAPPHHAEAPKAAALKDPTARNTLIVIAVMAFFVVLAFLVSRLSSPPPERVEYNHFVFVQNQGLWETQVDVRGQPYILTLRYNPYETENVTITGELNASFNRGPLHMTFDPEPQDRNFKYLALATGELGLSLSRALGRQTVQGCLSPAPFCDNITLVSCEDADKATVFLNDTGPARVVLRGSCVEIGGEGFELIRAIDRVLYQWYKIMR